jgi:hypothetical protein
MKQLPDYDRWLATEYEQDEIEFDIESIENKLIKYEQFVETSKEKLLVEIITYCKKEKGNMKKLSEKLGMNYSQLSNILNGFHNTSTRKLLNIYKNIT